MLVYVMDLYFTLCCLSFVQSPCKAFLRGWSWENLRLFNFAFFLPVRLLKVKPEERLTIEGVLAHPWLNCTEALDNVLPSAQMMMDKVRSNWCVIKKGRRSNVMLIQTSCVGNRVLPVLCEQAVVAGIQQAHAEQLANMRIQDLNISLKPLSSVNNPILRKRKLLGLVPFFAFVFCLNKIACILWDLLNFLIEISV